MRQEVERLIADAIQESIRVKQAILHDQEILRLIVAVAERMTEALRQGHKILLFGNGGSAADAQHIAAEFVGRFQIERTPLPAVALSTNTSWLTGIGNDYGYDEVSARPLAALGNQGDVAVGISTTGKSPNVIKGLAAARAKGLITVALAGRNGSKLREHSQYCLCVPAQETSRIQESHILIGHILCQTVEVGLFER